MSSPSTALPAGSTLWETALSVRLQDKPFQHNRASHLHAALPLFCIDVLTGKNWAASEAAHEARVAAELGLRPGMKVLDCGCGVGGPMRTIASTSGAHVTGNLNTLLTVAHVACCKHKATG